MHPYITQESIETGTCRKMHQNIIQVGIETDTCRKMHHYIIQVGIETDKCRKMHHNFIQVGIITDTCRKMHHYIIQICIETDICRKMHHYILQVPPRRCKWQCSGLWSMQVMLHTENGVVIVTKIFQLPCFSQIQYYFQLMSLICKLHVGILTK